MAIYRPPRPRWRAAAVGIAAGLLVGGLIGYALGNPNEPDLDAAIGAIEASLVRAAGSLEVVVIEYNEAVEDGEVVAEAEYQGSLDALASSRASYEDVASGLTALAPDRARAIEVFYDELEAAMAATEDSGEIELLVGQLDRLLKE